MGWGQAGELSLHLVLCWFWFSGSPALLHGSWYMVENGVEVKDACTHIIPLRNKEIAITAHCYSCGSERHREVMTSFNPRIHAQMRSGKQSPSSWWKRIGAEGYQASFKEYVDLFLRFNTMFDTAVPSTGFSREKSACRWVILTTTEDNIRLNVLYVCRNSISLDNEGSICSLRHRTFWNKRTGLDS